MNRNPVARVVAAALLGSTLYISVPAMSQPYGEGAHRPRSGQMSDSDRAQMREHMQNRMNQRMDRLAARLEIKASQQEAWDAYRKARGSMFEGRPQRPARDADAAALTRFRAEMAQRRAQYLLTMADATAKLQQVLEPQQRKVLDEIVRQGPRGKRGHGARHRGGHRGDGHQGFRGRA